MWRGYWRNSWRSVYQKSPVAIFKPNRPQVHVEYTKFAIYFIANGRWTHQRALQVKA